MYIDALTDTISFYTVTISKDSIGQEKKVKTILYNSIKGRVARKSERIIDEKGVFQEYKNILVLQVEKNYNGAERGDVVVFRGQNYTIVNKKEIKGVNDVEFLVYYLNERW